MVRIIDAFAVLATSVLVASCGNRDSVNLDGVEAKLVGERVSRDIADGREVTVKVRTKIDDNLPVSATTKNAGGRSADSTWRFLCEKKQGKILDVTLYGDEMKVIGTHENSSPYKTFPEGKVGRNLLDFACDG